MKISFDGMDFGPAEIEQNRQDVILLRDAALQASHFHSAVSLSHTIALLAELAKFCEQGENKVPCIKTGASAYVDQWQCWLHGDAYDEDGMLIFRASNRSFDGPRSKRLHIEIKQVSQWFDRDLTSAMQNSTVIARRGRWVFHGPEGKDIPAR